MVEIHVWYTLEHARNICPLLSDRNGLDWRNIGSRFFFYNFKHLYTNSLESLNSVSLSVWLIGLSLMRRYGNEKNNQQKKYKKNVYEIKIRFKHKRKERGRIESVKKGLGEKEWNKI